MTTDEKRFQLIRDCVGRLFPQVLTEIGANPNLTKEQVTLFCIGTARAAILMADCVLAEMGEKCH